MTYPEKLKYAREKLFLTQGEVAERLGVNTVTVCRWETGKSKPNIKAKKAISVFCEQNGIRFNDNEA